MIDKQRLDEILVQYKEDFDADHWEAERFKWEAIKHFQDHWDVDAADFAAMLAEAIKQTGSLLASTNNFPAGMLRGFAESVPEEVRAMFVSLFDETVELVERISSFKERAEALRQELDDSATNHFQSENAVTTYLWLRYPDKYYIYKYSEARAVAEQLGSNYRIIKGRYAENIRNLMALYDDLSAELRDDQDLRDQVSTFLTPDCYPDPELRTLAIDVGFYISQNLAWTPGDDDWVPSLEEYHPGLSVEDWVELLQNDEVFTPKSRAIVDRIKGVGGEATCKELSNKFGESYNFYNAGSSGLARRVVHATGCPTIERDSGRSSWWPVLYMGRGRKEKGEGSFAWRLREELSEALDKVKSRELANAQEPAEDQGDRRYWWLNASPKKFRFTTLPVGERENWTLYNENGRKRRIFQNYLDARAGDLVIAYESTPVKQVVALGRIEAAADDQNLPFKKTEGLATPIDYATLRQLPELQDMEFFSSYKGSLFKLTEAEYEAILDVIREENPVVSERASDMYTQENFLSEVFMSEESYRQLVGVLKNKKNIILQGAPGVGKTFAAKRLAWSIMGEMDDDRIKFVQFHQSYSYEDFMMGYKPSADGFELRNGVFYQFCQQAANHPDKDFFFIIDEINRGNMSKIFGELLMLIERDYRDTKVTLAYNGLEFSVPKNVFIIGMMNTADRSLAMIDYALRRRFSFIEMEPGFDTEGFICYRESLESEVLDDLVRRVQELNEAIKQDKSLGKGFCIGHSYFCSQTEATEEWLRSIVDYDILPMLSEYWFDDENTLKRWQSTLIGVFQQ